MQARAALVNPPAQLADSRTKVSSHSVRQLAARSQPPPTARSDWTSTHRTPTSASWPLVRSRRHIRSGPRCPAGASGPAGRAPLNPRPTPGGYATTKVKEHSLLMAAAFILYEFNQSKTERRIAFLPGFGSCLGVSLLLCSCKTPYKSLVHR